MDKLANSRGVSSDVLAARAGLDAIGMHQRARGLNPGSDGQPRQPLALLEEIHIARTLTLPVLDTSQVELTTPSE